MTTRTGYDGTYAGWQALQLTVPSPDLFAYGSSWTSAQIATLPSTTIKIAVDNDGTHASTTTVIDVETGKVTSVAVIAAWINAVNTRLGGYANARPTVYINSTGSYYVGGANDVLTPLASSTYGLHPGVDYDIWIADRTGVLPGSPMNTFGVPCVAWQWKSYAQTGHQYDVDVVFDSTWHPEPVSPPPPVGPNPPAPVVPFFPAGYEPQLADFLAWVYDNFWFLSQRVVFRGRQAVSSQSLVGAPVIVLDTIDEDPFSGWNPSGPAPSWTPPYDGWYRITATVWATGLTGIVAIELVGAFGIGEIATQNIQTAHAQGTTASAMAYFIGGQDSVYMTASTGAPGTGALTSIADGQQSSLEIVWESY